MRVLVVNSDLAANRGDRAIAEGLLAVVGEALPGARVTIISEEHARDRAWFGCDVLPQSIHSLSPVDLVRFLRAVRRSDLVLWGGGELLKDYTNRASLAYWVVKMGLASLTRTPIIGAFQGIGPTSAASSKRAIAWIARRMRVFVVRDDESAAKLVAWGVPAARVIASSDPAIIPGAGTGPAAPTSREWADRGLDDDFLRSFVAVAPRDWFHYRLGGLLPARLRPRRAADPRHAAYIDALVAMLDDLAERHGAVLMVPMHMTEDPGFARDLRAQMRNPSAARVLDSDDLSPAQLREVIARARLMVAFRLHAGILATAAGIPTITYYYVDKGRVFADRAGLADVARPIAQVLDPGALEAHRAMEEVVLGGRALASSVERNLESMRASIRAALASAVDAALTRRDRRG